MTLPQASRTRFRGIGDSHRQTLLRAAGDGGFFAEGCRTTSSAGRTIRILGNIALGNDTVGALKLRGLCSIVCNPSAEH